MDKILMIQCIFFGFLCGWTIAIAILGLEEINQIKGEKKNDRTKKTN